MLLDKKRGFSELKKQENRACNSLETQAKDSFFRDKMLNLIEKIYSLLDKAESLLRKDKTGIAMMTRMRLEQAFLESENLREVYPNLNDLMYVLRVTPDGILEYHNPESSLLVEKIWGINNGDRIPKEWADVFSKAFETRESQKIELEVGEKVFVISVAIPETVVADKTPNAESSEAVGFILDITEKKRLENDLTDAKDDALEFPDANELVKVLRVAGDGTIQFANKKANNLMQKAGLKAENKIPADLLGIVQNSISSRKRERSEVKIEDRFYLIEAVPLSNKENNTPKNEIAMFLLDITERKEMEEAIKKSEEKYRNILENMEETYFEVDLAGNLTFTNPSAEGLMGMQMKDLLGIGNREYTSPEESEKAYKVFKRVFKTGQTERIDNYGIKTKNGNSKIVELSVSPKRDNQGEIIGFFGFAKDITERIDAQKSALRSEKLAAVGRLSGGIAHDFNNTLAIIIGNADLAIKNLDDKGALRDRLSKILRAANDGTRLPRDLLNFSGDMDIILGDYNINKLVGEVVNLMRELRKDVNIKLDPEKNLNLVQVDLEKFKTVITNIIVNSLHAMPNGGNLNVNTSNISLSQAKAEALDLEQGNYIKLDIIDDGVGMDKETKAKIFDPFFSTRKDEGGTGLGLSTSLGIIKKHGGSIEVQSKEGKGTRFSIYLPASKEKMNKKAKKSEKLEIIEGNGETVLILDDEESVLEVTSSLLEELGYKVIATKKTEEAMDAFLAKQEDVDLVISDLTMPGKISGLDFCESIKKINPEIKILISSGNTKILEGQDKETQAYDDVIGKPFSLLQISHTVHDLLKEKSKSIRKDTN